MKENPRSAVPLKTLIILASTAIVVIGFFIFQNPPAIKNTSKIQPSPNLDITNWKTYRNEKYGFEIKYPNNFFYNEFNDNYQKSRLLVIFVYNQYKDKEYNYPYVGITIFVTDKSPEAFLKEIGTEVGPLEESADTREYVWFGVTKPKANKINDLSTLQFTTETVSTGTNHTLFKKGDYLYDVFNRITGVGEVSEEIYNQILSTFQFIE